MSGPTLARTGTEPVVLGAGRHLADDIDVVGCADGRSRGIGDPEMHGGAADEDDLVEQRAEDGGGGLELERAHRFPAAIWSRSIRERNSPATLRTRASPALRLSSSERASVNSGQPATASGAA
jgi:hypothetical protein